MNLEELKGALSTMADEVQGTDTVSRLAEVDGKVRSNRRRKVVGVIAAAACIVAIGVAAPFVAQGLQSPAQPADHSGSLPTLRDHGIPFYTSPAGNRLLVEKVGRPGQSDVQFSFTPHTTFLRFVAVCSAPYTKSQPYFVHFEINGQPVSDATCAGTRGLHDPAHGLFLDFTAPVINGSYELASAMTVTPGVVNTGEVWLSRGLHGSIVSAPRAQIGGAVYLHSRDVEKVHGVAVERQVVTNGHLYRLTASKVEDIAGRGDLQLRLPSSQTPVWVVGGVSNWSGKFKFSIPNGRMSPFEPAGGSFPMAHMQSGGSASFTVQGARGTKGTAYLLAYTRIS